MHLGHWLGAKEEDEDEEVIMAHEPRSIPTYPCCTALAPAVLTTSQDPLSACPPICIVVRMQKKQRGGGVETDARGKGGEFGLGAGGGQKRAVIQSLQRC